MRTQATDESRDLSRFRVIAIVVATALSQCHPHPPTRTAPHDAPAARDCDALWSAYRSLAPDDTVTPREAFVAQCTHSDRAVLHCVDQVRARAAEAYRSAREGDDAAPVAVPPRILQMAAFSGMPWCMERERMRHAVETGEADRLVEAVRAGSAHPDARGVLTLPGAFATLTRSGRAWVNVRPHGRIWIYALGALLGRHTNQAGFLYSSAPFVAADISGDGDITLPAFPDDDADGVPAPRGDLPAHVIDHLAPQLLEIGWSPS